MQFDFWAFRAIRASASNSTMLWTLWTWCQHCRSALPRDAWAWYAMTCFSVKMVPNLNLNCGIGSEFCSKRCWSKRCYLKTESFWIQLLDTQNIRVICCWNDIVYVLGGGTFKGHWGFLSVYIPQSSISSGDFHGFSIKTVQLLGQIDANRLLQLPFQIFQSLT